MIYATGFQWMATGTFNMVTGRDGRTLREKWQQEGVRTFLGLHSAGFPNLFILSGPQGGGGQFNFTRGIEGHTDYVTWMLTTLRDRGAATVDIKKEPEDAYAAHCRDADLLTAPLRDCLSYYNGDGNAEPGSLAYYGGPRKWHELRIAAQTTMEPYIFK
jgi:cyclohexanone monooxygenase